MKKLLMAFVCLFALVALVACNNTNNTDNNNNENNGNENNNNGGETTTEAEYTLGMGVVVVLGHSQSATAVQVDSTVAAVVLDKDGKIVTCRIDALQNIGTVVDGAIDADEYEAPLSKAEKGDDYGMSAGAAGWGDVNGDGEVKEWYEQAQAFETFVTGKTVAEVEAMTTEANKLGYQWSTDADLLAAGCTIQIGEFRDAVVAACKDEQNVKFTTSKEFTLGVAATGTFDAKNSSEGVAALYSEYATSVVIEGKIAATLNDAVQPKVEFTGNGENQELVYENTKRCLLEDYGMSAGAAAWGDVNGDGEVKEWYLQSAAFSAHVTGMTAAEVKAMTTEANKLGYQWSTDADLLAAGCTIQITTIRDVVAASAENAR